ncbi:MAG TPA: polysaccharide deacetylase family protein [Opitutaceae bacterium]|jgi:peptidoglycan/xylan/chitin deacetylase (PgdA/CDA1 family)|nr:polysaccharide deacetylase family protein [Opitutaceae bacterium]
MRPLLVCCNLLGKFAAVAVWHQSHWAAVGCFIAPDLALLYGILAPASQLLCPVVTSFRPQPGRPEVWLTIDDGPDPADTPQILDLLDRHGARATFFAIGRRAEEHPGLILEIARRGHQIGHHTHTHPQGTFWIAGPKRVRFELDRAAAALRAADPAPTVFRPPVGIKNLFLRTELARRRMTCIGWTIRSGDCFARNPRRITERVLRELRPGAIVLVHEGPSVPSGVRVVFLAELLAEISARGYACVIPAPRQWLPPAATGSTAGVASDGRQTRPA